MAFPGDENFSIAKLKLRDVEAELRGGGSKPSGSLEANLTFESAFHRYRATVQAVAKLSVSTKHFRLRSEKTLRRIWPEDCQRWLNDFRNGGAAYRPNKTKSNRSGDSPTTVNAAIRFLRHVFAIGVRAGILYSNPGDTLKTLSPRKKLLQLPNRTQFAELVASIRATHTRRGQAPGDLVEGLAYTGARVGESRKMKWAHVDEERRWVAEVTPGLDKGAAAPSCCRHVARGGVLQDDLPLADLYAAVGAIGEEDHSGGYLLAQAEPVGRVSPGGREADGIPHDESTSNGISRRREQAKHRISATRENADS